MKSNVLLLQVHQIPGNTPLLALWGEVGTRSTSPWNMLENGGPVFVIAANRP